MRGRAARPARYHEPGAGAAGARPGERGGRGRMAAPGAGRAWYSRAMRMWVDADALPGEVKEIVLRAARRTGIAVVFVANKNVRVETGPLVSFVRVAAGPDEADAHIVDHAEAGDLCVTADIPLAAALVQKGLTAIDPRGDLYSESSVGERLSVRDLMASLREAGVATAGPPPFDARAKQRFAARLDALLTRALKESG